MLKLNFSDFNIITLKPYVTNFNHGYVIVWVSRQPFMQTKTQQLAFKVGKANRAVTQNVLCVFGWSTNPWLMKSIYTNGCD